MARAADADAYAALDITICARLLIVDDIFAFAFAFRAPFMLPLLLLLRCARCRADDDVAAMMLIFSR